MLQEAFGYAASANIGRVSAAVSYPDYDCIDDYVQKHNAKCLSLIIDKQLFYRMNEYTSIDEVIADFVGIEHIYKSNITEW